MSKALLGIETHYALVEFASLSLKVSAKKVKSILSSTYNKNSDKMASLNDLCQTWSL